MEPPIAFDRYSETIENELKEILQEHSGLLYKMIQYQLGWIGEDDTPLNEWKGKRLHPSLCLAACESLGGDLTIASTCAAAVELVYNFSLVHYDVQDGNPNRHGKPTLWWLWGPAQAINAGNGLHALARLSLIRLKEKGFDDSIVMKAMQILDDTCLKLFEGQHMNLQFQERLDVSTDAYFNMITGKTGELMSCAMQLGALTATQDENLIKAFGQCGLGIGIAYQIRSDVLDLWQGKRTNMNDGELLTKKKTFPIVWALENGDFKLKRELGSIYFKRVLNKEDVNKIVHLLDSIGVKKTSEATIEIHYTQVLKRLKDLEIPSEGRDNIMDIVSFMINRDT